MNKYLVRVALVLALVLMPVLTGCDKDDVIQPQAVPISDFRNIRVVDLQVTDDADLDGDLAVAGALALTGALSVDGDLDVDARVHINPAATPGATTTPDAIVKASGATNNVFQIENSSATPVVFWNPSGAGYLTGNHTLAGTFTVGASATTGADVTFYSDTSGDYLMWDASEAVLNIIGTNAANALNVSDGNVVIADTLDVNGAVDMDGTGFDVAISAGWYIEGATEGILTTTGAGEDVVIEAAAGRVVVKGDEATADGVYVDADDNAATGLTVATGATAGAVFSGGPVILPRKVIAKTGVSAVLTAAECWWTIVSDLGDTGGITITLPAAVAGMDVLLYNKTGEDWIIDCDDADQIFDLTDAAGNKITNTTAFDYVHLVALDGAGWYTLDVHGTWTDAN